MTLGNTRVLEDKPIQKDFKNLLQKDVPILTENDANCFALAEYHLGAGTQHKIKNLVGVILGTGVGGGIVIGGKILKGKRGSAGEIGHTFFKKTGLECYCGQKDCAESYLSGTGFEAYYLEKTGIKKPLQEIFQEPAFFDIYKKDLAAFLGQMTNVLDPDAFVLGGGISLQDGLYENIHEFMVPHLFYKKNPPEILKHAISDSAGGIGAALLMHSASFVS
jgi:fructokinase